MAFNINNQKFAIDIDNVLEAIETADITHIIHTPEYIAGVINLRGNIIAIIDLQELLMLPPIEKNNYALLNKIIIVKEEKKIFGLLVDEIIDIIEKEDSALISLPVSVTGKLAEFLQGLLIIDENEKEPICVINTKNIVLSEEIRKFDYD
ncbi:MAG TPA: chemotaxis protein CheW [bacterium]|nr:chemotaxis protein CheW [bacterium]